MHFLFLLFNIFQSYLGIMICRCLGIICQVEINNTFTSAQGCNCCWQISPRGGGYSWHTHNLLFWVTLRKTIEQILSCQPMSALTNTLRFIFKITSPPARMYLDTLVHRADRGLPGGTDSCLSANPSCWRWKNILNYFQICRAFNSYPKKQSQEDSLFVNLVNAGL